MDWINDEYENTALPGKPSIDVLNLALDTLKAQLIATLQVAISDYKMEGDSEPNFDLALEIEEDDEGMFIGGNLGIVIEHVDGSITAAPLDIEDLHTEINILHDWDRVEIARMLLWQYLDCEICGEEEIGVEDEDEEEVEDEYGEEEEDEYSEEDGDGKEDSCEDEYMEEAYEIWLSQYQLQKLYQEIIAGDLPPSN